MLLEYSTSNIILRVEMLTISSGATDLFFASLCICYLLLFLLPRSGLYPTEEQIAVKHELKKEQTYRLRLEHFCDSLQVSEPSGDVRGFEDLCRSFLILLK